MSTNGITDKNQIYYELCVYGLSDEEKESENLLAEDQDKLLASYKHKPFSVCGKANGFLVFRDQDVEEMRARKIDKEAIKLYIPTNKENIQEVAPELFDYLLNRYVMHETKISNDIRSDDIVIRVYDDRYVKGIVDFVNEKLSDKVIKTNPFVMRDGVVGIARDGGLSYNERISKFLSEYLLSNQENSENVNSNGFEKYVQGLRTKILTDKEYISQVLSEEDRKHYSRVSDLDYIYDNATIMELVILALNKEKGIEDFNEYWKSITNKQEVEELKKKISDVLVEIQEEKKEESEKVETKTEKEKTIKKKRGKPKKVEETPIKKEIKEENKVDEYYYLAEEIIEDPTMINEILDRRSNEELERLYFTLKQMHEDIIGDISEVFKEEDKEKDEQIKYMMDLIYDELERNEQEQEEYDEMAQHEADKKADEERRKREAEYEQDDYYKGYEEETEEWQYDHYDEETNDEYDKDGYNRDGFNKEGIHRVTKTKFNPDGYDKEGFDKKGLNEFGETREEYYKGLDDLDDKVKRQYFVKENGFEPEKIEDGSVKETTVEESVYSNTENENKEVLIEELSNVKYYLSELEKKMNVEDFSEQYESFEIEDMWRERHSYEDRIEEIESEIYMIEMGELGTSLTSMTPDEIKQQYEGLLEKRKSYRQMAEDGYEVDELEWKINNGLIEMIEEYIKNNPELSEFEQPSNDEIEALLAKEMKSKSFRDAGFEVNEFGEIIRPERKEKSKQLEDMTIEELQEAIQQNDKTIKDNDKIIKQRLVKRLLEQQKIIDGQQAEIDELSRQKGAL